GAIAAARASGSGVGPGWTMRVPPASWARAMLRCISPSKSAKSRWQWLSTNSGAAVIRQLACSGGEATRRLVDLQKGIHEKRSRVKVDRFAAPRPRRQLIRKFGPDPGGIGIRGKSGDQPCLIWRGLGWRLAKGAGAGKARQEGLDQRQDQIEAVR